MMKYKITENAENLSVVVANYHSYDKTSYFINKIDTFLRDWQENFSRKPKCEYAIAGIDVFNYLSLSPLSKIVDGDKIWIELYGVKIGIVREWSIDPLHLEIKLQ